MTADSPKAHKPRVFVLYVREDQDVVDRLANELTAYGIKVWLDKTELKPGYRWKDAIREAISEGDFFVACFSDAYQKRSKSYMNEELTLAIEELRKRPTDRTWFIPVLLSESEVPARNIGAGETLRDIQWVDLHQNWEQGVIKIATAIDPDAEIGQSPRVWQLNDSEWSDLMYCVSSSEFVLVLGRGINYGVVPTDEVLGRKWARELEKPEWMGLPFSQVAEQLDQTYGHSYLVKTLVKEYTQARLSKFNATGGLHAVLSRLPCQMFITTCIDSFMEDALTSRGKQPNSAIVNLRDRMRASGGGFTPTVTTVSEPLVVHVFGRLDVPESLAVTVDDQMRLLDQSGGDRRPIPIEATYMLYRFPAIWLGFDWETIERRAITSLLAHEDPASRPKRFFDREFEMLARQEGRQRILLREFMTEFQSRWEREGREQSP